MPRARWGSRSLVNYVTTICGEVERLEYARKMQLSLECGKELARKVDMAHLRNRQESMART